MSVSIKFSATARHLRCGWVAHLSRPVVFKVLKKQRPCKSLLLWHIVNQGSRYHEMHQDLNFSVFQLFCRSSDSYIQEFLHFYQNSQRAHFAFSPNHYSPSNDRFSPHADISLSIFSNQLSSAWKQHFVLTATKDMLCLICKATIHVFRTFTWFPCSAWTRMRVRSALLTFLTPHLPPCGSRICHKSTKIY